MLKATRLAKVLLGTPNGISILEQTVETFIDNAIKNAEKDALAELYEVKKFITEAKAEVNG